MDGDDDGIRNGILEWSTNDNTALVSNAVVVDLTDADKSSENSYGRNVNSVSTLQRLLDNATAYEIDVSMFVNKDNEVEAIFITKIAGGPSVPSGGDETEVDDSVKTVVMENTGKVTVTLNEAVKEETTKEVKIFRYIEAQDKWMDAGTQNVTISASSDSGNVTFSVTPGYLYRAECGGVPSENVTIPNS